MNARTQPPPLPDTIDIHDWPLPDTLALFAERLATLAEEMPFISDFEVDFSVDPQTGRCSLHFRACR